MGCSFFHGAIHDKSKTVYQRNPFDHSNRYVNINIVELPYSRDPFTNEINYHGRFLLQPHFLKSLRRSTGCTIKLCGNTFNVPVRYSHPYVFVYGESQIKVDEAVNMITNAIEVTLENHLDWKWIEDSEQRKYSLNIQLRKK